MDAVVPLFLFDDLSLRNLHILVLNLVLSRAIKLPRVYKIKIKL